MLGSCPTRMSFILKGVDHKAPCEVAPLWQEACQTCLAQALPGGAGARLALAARQVHHVQARHGGGAPRVPLAQRLHLSN